MLEEAIKGHGLNWQFDEIEVDNDLHDTIQSGGNMSLLEAQQTIARSATMPGALMLSEMDEVKRGKVAKGDTEGAALFFKLMKTSLIAKQEERMHLLVLHRQAVEQFVERLSKLQVEIGENSKALTTSLARRSEAWVNLKKNERAQAEETAKYEEERFYHSYVMMIMKKDKSSLERTQKLLGEGYNQTCPSGFFMFIQKCGQTNRLKYPALVQTINQISLKLRTHVQSDMAKALDVPISQLMAKDDAEVQEVDVETNKEEDLTDKFYQQQIDRSRRQTEFEEDEIQAEEAASVEMADDTEESPMVAHNLLMSDPEEQLMADSQEVMESFLQVGGEPAATVIYPNCTKPNCKILKPVVADIDADLQQAIESLIRQISDRAKKWSRRTAENAQLTRDFGDAITKYNTMYQESSVEFRNYNSDKGKLLKRLKKLYKEISAEQRSWTEKMTSCRNDMCALIMFRNSAVDALKKPKINDCLMTKWKRSSACTKDCGGGVSEYKRQVLLNASAEGVPCPRKCLNASWDGKSMKTCTQSEVLVQKQVICNTHVCPTDCQVNPWSSYGTCQSIVEGSRKGRQSRTRSIAISPANKGLKCGALEEDKACFMTGGKFSNCKEQEWLQAGQIKGERQRFTPKEGEVLIRNLWQINYASPERAGCKRKPNQPQPIYKNQTLMKCTMGQYTGCSPLLEKEKFTPTIWNRTRSHWIQSDGDTTLNNMPAMSEMLKNPPEGTDYVIGCNSKGKLSGPNSGDFAFITAFDININSNAYKNLEVGCSKPEKMTQGMGKCYKDYVESRTGSVGNGWVVGWGWCKDGYYLTNLYALASEADKAFLNAVRYVQCCKRGWPGGATR